jgi:hypothetical protein
MGGESSSQTQQQTISNPWEPAQPALQGVLGQLNGAIPNTGLNASETGAFNQLLGSAAQGNPFAGSINDYVKNLLAGGGANAQSGAVQGSYDTLKSQLMPWANGAMGDPTNNPALRQMLDVIRADTTNSINSQFAGAGRDFSGINQQALARGLASGEAPILLQAQTQGLGAAKDLYNAGNTTSGILSGLNQQGLANQGQGLANNQAAIDANNYGAQTTLNLQDMMRGLPIQNLSRIAQLLVPIAGLGGQTNSTSNTTNQASGATQFGQIAGGLGSLGKLFSDRAMKENIIRISELENGLGVYSFAYKGFIGDRIGLMDDEVAQIHPDAVIPTLLFNMVDYDQAVL